MNTPADDISLALDTIAQAMGVIVGIQGNVLCRAGMASADVGRGIKEMAEMIEGMKRGSPIMAQHIATILRDYAKLFDKPPSGPPDLRVVE